jgi:hypothetical protein
MPRATFDRLLEKIAATGRQISTVIFCKVCH